MARSRIRNSRHAQLEKKPKAIWPSDVEVELLVWLSFTAEKDGSGKLFNDSIIHHLKTAFNLEYQEGQVDRKVRSMLDAGGRTAKAKGLSELYKIGTKSLKWLDGDLKKTCEDRLDELKSQELLQKLLLPRDLRSLSRTPDTLLLRRISNRLRDTQSPSPCPPRHHDFLVKDRASVGGCAKDKQLSHVSLTPEYLETPKTESFTIPCHGKRCWQVASTSEREPATQHHRSTEEVSTPHAYPRIPTISEFSIVRDNDMMDLAESEIIVEQPSECRSDIEICEHIPPVPSSSTERCDCAALRRDVRALQQDNNSLFNSYQSEVKEARNQQEALNRELNCLKSSYEQILSADQRSNMHTLKLREIEIKELRKCLDRKERYRGTLQLSTDDVVPLDRKQICVEMIQIKRAVKNLLDDHEFPEGFELPKVILEQDLRDLFRRSFALDPSKANALPDLRGPSRLLALQAVMRSLTAAAICEWVFEADLPSISNPPDALLEQYRLQLAVQDGDIALRNLDLAAHRSLFTEENFQRQVVLRTATRLAERFISLLEPLLSQSCDSKASTDGIDAWSRELPTLIEIFHRALKVKVCTMVSDKFFEAVMCTSGAPFKSACMDPETLEGDQAQIHLYKDPVAKFCILPALVAYDGNRKLVSNRCFLTGGKVGESLPQPLTKAVVIVETPDQQT